MRRTLRELRPDLVFVFNCAGIPQAALMVAIDTGVPVALRLSETSFATNLLWGDRFLRHLRPGGRPLLAPVGLLARAVNRAEPALRLRPASASRVAISWASNELRARTTLPTGMEVALERVVYPASLHAEGFADLERRPSERPAVLYLGRVTVGKGIQVAYRALAALRAHHGVDARLVVVGHADRAMRKRLDALGRELGIGEQVELWGRVENGIFSVALQRSHVIVVPSLVPDVFPLVVVEAALARVPIVASRIGGIPEAVADGEEALLFEPGDADACASALAQTITEPDLAEERAARAFTRASALSMDRYVKESEAFVTDALAALRANGS